MLTKGGKFHAERPSKNSNQDVNVRCALLCGGVYFVPIAVHAGAGYGFDVRAELDSLHFAAKADVHGNFDLHFAGRGRLASLRGRTRLKSAIESGRRILFRVDNRVFIAERVQRRNSEFQTLHRGKYFNRGADNLFGWANLDDFNDGRRNFRGVNNGGVPVHTWRRVKGVGSGICRREIAKGIGRAINLIAEKIISGERLQPDDDLSFLLESPLDELQAGAGMIQKHFCGNHIDLCTIINGKSGRCSENCKYCAQSARHKTGIDEYEFLPVKKILAVALANEAAGVNRFSIVTSGRALDGKNFERAIEAYTILRSRLKNLELCASHGILNREQLKRLRAAGVTSYHHNLETSRRFFPQICTTHTYDERIQTIKLAQAEGFCVCSGGIIGMGETWQDRIDLAFELAGLGIESIPVNVLNAIKGTALENLKPLGAEDILRTIAIFRYINPTANVRLAAGRKFMPDNGASALLHGASASITGNMLTTSNNSIKNDMRLLAELGLTNKTL